MNRRTILWVALAATACGPVRAGDDLGEPLYTLSAQLRGVAVDPPRGEYRAVFGWVSFGGGPYVECLESAVSIFDCNAADGYDSSLLLFDAPVRAVLPAGMQLDFFAFPERSSLLDYHGAVFLLGGMAIYDDRDLDGSFTPDSEVGAGDGDVVVAESIYIGRQSAVVFREGPLHPINWVLNRVLACNEPPQGFSVARVEGFLDCTVAKEQPLLVTASTPEAIARASCGGQIASFTIVDQPQPPRPLPDNAVVTCLDDNRLSWWPDEGSYCDQFRVSTYALQGSERIMGRLVTWDFRETPPADWPCPIDP